MAQLLIQNKCNDRFARQVLAKLRNGTDPTDVKTSSKLSRLKPLNERQNVDLYTIS